MHGAPKGRPRPDQESPSFTGSRGVGYYSKGDYDRAIQDTDQAIRLNPNEPSFYYTRGLAYKKRGDFDRAIQDFTKQFA